MRMVVTLGWVLARTATCLLMMPCLPRLSNCTSILPWAPGATGSLVQLGVVQPQEAVASSISSGELPVLVNTKVWCTLVSGLMSPKLNSCSAKVITGALGLGATSSFTTFGLSTVGLAVASAAAVAAAFMPSVPTSLFLSLLQALSSSAAAKIREYFIEAGRCTKVQPGVSKCRRNISTNNCPVTSVPGRPWLLEWQARFRPGSTAWQ